jgi:hypothetical protein
MYGDSIVMIDSTYRGVAQKATFIDKVFGEWVTTPDSLLGGRTSRKRGSLRRRETSLLRFGTEFPVQNKIVSDKLAKSQNNKVTIKHWKTGEDVICTSSFEYAVVTKLNELKINFDWQIHFRLESLNRVYICDLFLPDENKYVEIKGRFVNEINKRKWEEFKKIYPNSELWKMKEVTRFAGISYYKMKLEFKKLFNEQKIKQSFGMQALAEKQGKLLKE